MKGLTVTDASGGKVWDDNFATDSTARYQWHLSPRSGPNALWVWGWYGRPSIPIASCRARWARS